MNELRVNHESWMNIHIMNFIHHVKVVFVIIAFKLSIWKPFFSMITFIFAFDKSSQSFIKFSNLLFSSLLMIVVRVLDCLHQHLGLGHWLIHWSTYKCISKYRWWPFNILLNIGLSLDLRLGLRLGEEWNVGLGVPFIIKYYLLNTFHVAWPSIVFNSTKVGSLWNTTFCAPSSFVVLVFNSFKIFYNLSLKLSF